MTAGTIAALLDECAAQRPNRPLLLDASGVSLTVGDVAALVSAATGWLWKSGVRPGMTVAWQLPSDPGAAVIMLALARAAVTQAPLLHLYREREVRAALDVASADILIVDRSTASNAPPRADTIVVPDDLIQRLGRQGDAEPHNGLCGHRADDAAYWLYFTSGTTGKPKGVCHDDTTLLSASRGFVDHYGLGSLPDEVGTITFPIAHVGGLVYLAGALLGDFPVLLIPKVSDDLPEVLASHRVTVAGASTTFYQMLLSAQLASGRAEPLIPTLRMIIGGGAACPPEVHRQIRRSMGIPIMHAYGMTEAPMVCVSHHGDSEEQLHNTSGRPVPGAHVRISECGEIEVCGDTLGRGYTDAEQWAQALSADGWFRTGDRGRLRADGHIVVTGRTKDLIIRKGENIAPEEIENDLLAHPLVDEVAVVGLRDEFRGEMVCAVVRRSLSHPDITFDELCAFLDERGLMKQKWPERLVVVDELPMTGLGKVAKSHLAQQISAGAIR
ncbi:class I adenylate-forming enzyme family protein [Mycobacterium vicinigordonae]|uniref:AMP-binding protein n=1 Tax=Mycobacterium vicinigordonae TaxID=1719132 RepID=A0A7D6HYI1_9MYCO|nr:AMP-binding protein [Mycobacterium vicinigordonae]QLL10113.1 AMP-binding protein [Mycobacterium vicinigordonae]